MSKHIPRERPLIAFFDYHDVFEDFYPHYGVDQRSFATGWADTANHAWLSLVQREIGDVVWYMFSLAPELVEAQHKLIGCHVKFFPSPWLHRCLWRAFYLPRFAWRWRRAYRAYATTASYIALVSWPFFRTLLRDRPDFFFVQDYATGRFDVLLLIARMLGIPLVAFHSGSRPEYYLGRGIKRWTIPRANWLFPSGRDELDMLAGRYQVPRARLEVIRPPVDTAVFRPVSRTAACCAAGLDLTRRYVLFVGRLDDEVKRVSAIIKAFAATAAEHRDADLVIVGDGRDGDRLRTLAAEQIPGRVHFTGWVSELEAKVQLYNVAECLVLASWREASPAVISEAFACGTPVLASQVGAIRDLVIEGQTGWSFPAGNDEALSAALSFALTHPEIVASMRPQVRKFAETCVSPAAITAVLKRGFSAIEGQYG
jgi:glycosyltransferase involved in cell wall biosynthesis